MLRSTHQPLQGSAISQQRRQAVPWQARQRTQRLDAHLHRQNEAVGGSMTCILIPTTDANPQTQKQTCKHRSQPGSHCYAPQQAHAAKRKRSCGARHCGRSCTLLPPSPGCTAAHFVGGLQVDLHRRRQSCHVCKVGRRDRAEERCEQTAGGSTVLGHPVKPSPAPARASKPLQQWPHRQRPVQHTGRLSTCAHLCRSAARSAPGRRQCAWAPPLWPG